MTSMFSWQNSVSPCLASFCTPKPNLPVTPSISWLLFLHSYPLWWKGHFFLLLLVLEGLIGLHRTSQLQLLWYQWLQHRLGLLWCWVVCLIVLISHTSKVMLKVLKAWLQQYVSQELPDVQAGLEKGEEPEIANIHWIIKKAREFQKSTYFCFTDYAKDFDCVDHNKLGNS